MLFKGGAGGRAAFFEFEDMYGRVRAKLRGDKIDTFSFLLSTGDPVLVTGKVSFPMTEASWPWASRSPRSPTVSSSVSRQ
jgi:DNA polymerase-3 subunit alpha